MPGKNVRKLLGKPLIAHSIDQAMESGIFDAVAISSDSMEILEAARSYGAQYIVKRPPSMASDTASKLPPIQHAVETVENELNLHFDTVVDIDVTSPLRTVEDIRGSVDLLESKCVRNVITGSVARKNPYFNLVEQREDGSVGLSKPLPKRLERRQDCPACFDMNAAVYVWQRDIIMDDPGVFYKDTLLYEMPEERSHDIDTPLDFDFVEYLMKRNSEQSTT